MTIVSCLISNLQNDDSSGKKWSFKNQDKQLWFGSARLLVSASSKSAAIVEWIVAVHRNRKQNRGHNVALVDLWEPGQETTALPLPPPLMILGSATVSYLLIATSMEAPPTVFLHRGKLKSKKSTIQQQWPSLPKAVPLGFRFLLIPSLSWFTDSPV